MPLNKPPLNAKPDVLADWVELRTLAAKNGMFSLARLKRYWDTQREREDSDTEGRSREEEDTEQEGVSGADEEKFMDAIEDEIASRGRLLKQNYPFGFTADANKFRLRPSFSLGGWVYILCLLLQHHWELGTEN